MKRVCQSDGVTGTMHVLMLGWEFPPYITGGLGTACLGLTRALDERDIEVTFVLPKPAVGDPSVSGHVRLLSPEVPEAASAEATGVRRVEVPAGFVNPYQQETGWRTVAMSGSSAARSVEPKVEVRGDYDGDLIAEVERYARFCVDRVSDLDFDVVHAHDWMTYPAGLAVARSTGRPLAVHVHSTEFDRSGEQVNQQVYDVERRGMHGADRVLVVSHRTGGIVRDRYGVGPSNITVVHNGVDLPARSIGRPVVSNDERIVLYFGRITYQKGPEYFVRSAKRVLEVEKDVTFVVAGSGDLAMTMMRMASEAGIGHRVLFTGFLRGDEIERVFSMADLYVMPSISEPFGIAPLEAMGRDVPALISRSSGVAEILTHALKVDFWDVDEIANKIIAVLRHPSLKRTLRDHGRREVRGITWSEAAKRCEGVYEGIAASRHHRIERV